MASYAAKCLPKNLMADMSMTKIFMAKVTRIDQIMPRHSEMGRSFYTRASRACPNRSRPAMKCLMYCV